MIGGKNRYISKKKALRKRKIDRQISYGSRELYDNLNQYSKNKIHCSCPICSAKTRNKGKRRHGAGGWEPSINYKISDLRKQQEMDYQEEEALNVIMEGKPNEH